ncbi:MAG: hypothetical protein WKF81_06610 [Thermomicrobiales bacterium]
MTTREQQFDVAIWGAGIAGSLLALSLSTAGFRVAVIPKGPATKPLRPGFSIVDGTMTPTDDMERTLLKRAEANGAFLFGDDTVDSLEPPIGPVRAVITSSGRITVRALILADGSDPRVGRERGLLPEWEPWQLVHFAYGSLISSGQTAPAFDVIAGARAEYPWRGYRIGNIIGVGWYLQHEMESRVHVTELLDDVRERFVGACFDQRDPLVEVVPYEPRHLEAGIVVDNVIAIGDLVGIVNPLSLRRSELSLKMAERVSRVVGDWLRGGSPGTRDLKRMRSVLKPLVGTEQPTESGPPMLLVPRPPERGRGFGPLIRRLVER